MPTLCICDGAPFHTTSSLQCAATAEPCHDVGLARHSAPQTCFLMMAWRFDCRDPLVIPFYHSGMAQIMPEHGRIPRVGQTVAVTVGEPIDLSDLTCECSGANLKVCSLLFQIKRGFNPIQSSKPSSCRISCNHMPLRQPCLSPSGFVFVETWMFSWPCGKGQCHAVSSCEACRCGWKLQRGFAISCTS